MANLNSDKVFVFPTTTRAPIDAKNGQYITEYNMTSLINRLTNRAAFVISEDVSDLSNFEFNMYGYYFKIDLSNFDFPTGNYIMAAVWIECTDSGMLRLYSDGSPDDNNMYQCLNITGFQGGLGSLHHISTSDFSKGLSPGSRSLLELPILELTAPNTYQIPSDSKIKFTQASIHMDDGDLDET